MANFDLVKSLVSLGVDEKSAETLKAKLRGDDLMGLINALNSDDIANGIDVANEILGKYNVVLGKGDQMDEYRNAEMDALKRGDMFAVESFINEWLSPVESKLAEGFGYSLELNETNRDKVLDWLDEQKIDYLAQTPGVFQIKCEDRATAYRVSKALSGMMGPSVVRDSQEIGEDEVVSEKKADKQIRAAKDKLANLKPRDPVAASLSKVSGGGAHKGDPRKSDPMGRGAKHKSRFEEDFDGAEQDGELEMTQESNDSRLEEGVMGTTGLDPIFRLRELAGLRALPVAETDLLPVEDDMDDMGADPMAPVEMDMDGPLAPGAVDMGGDLDMDPAIDGGMDADPMADMGMDDGMGIDDGMGVDPMAADPMGMDPMGGDLDALDAPAGMPGDLPPMGAGAPLGMGMPNQSEAMMGIEDSLNGIQAKLPEIRLSEYKSLVLKLQDLAMQVQNMGRDYLGERRKK